jgi:cytochrome P450
MATTWPEALQEGALRTLGRGLALFERARTGAAYDPLARGILTDPYPAYQRLRERDPVHRSLLAGGWVISRFADAETVLRDPRFSADDRSWRRYPRIRARAERAGVWDEQQARSPSLLRLDPPDHSRLRGLVTRAFTPRAVAALAPRIEKLVDELLDSVAASGCMDVIHDLAAPLPVTVIAEMLGVPDRDRARFKHWSDQVVRSLGVPTLEDLRQARRAGIELRAYFACIAEDRRREPRDDLLSALLRAEEEGDKLSSFEVLSTCTLLLVAGNETTTNLIGNGLLALLRHPEQLALLREDPARVEGAVEEMLRYDSPVQLTSRFPLEELELRGRRFRRGEQVLVLLGSANRDPEVNREPERFDVTRSEVRHLAFGFGSHYCLGAALARLEARLAVSALLRRMPGLRLATDRPRWRSNTILRGLQTLPVAF